MTSLAFMFVCVPLPVCQTNEREVVVELAVDDFVGGADDEVDLLRRQRAQLAVDQRGGLLEDAERADHRPRKVLARRC